MVPLPMKFLNMTTFQYIKSKFLERKKLFLLMHALFWATFIFGIVSAIINPQLTLGLIRHILNNKHFKFLHEIIKNNFVLAVFLIFTFNLFRGNMLWISVPSFLFSNIGVIAGLVRAYLWGLIFAYVVYKQKMLGILGIPHCLFFLLLALLEGEGSILGMIGGFFVYSNIFHAEEWLESRRRWLKVNLEFYKMIALILFISAILEVSGIRIISFMKH